MPGRPDRARRDYGVRVTPAPAPSAAGSSPAQRWWARAALLAAALTVIVLVVTEGVAAVVVPLLAALALAVGLGGLWALVTRRGPLRWVGLAVAVAAPLVLLAVAARYDLIPGFLAAGALGLGTVLLARRSLRPDLPDQPDAGDRRNALPGGR